MPHVNVVPFCTSKHFMFCESIQVLYVVGNLDYNKQNSVWHLVLPSMHASLVQFVIFFLVAHCNAGKLL